MTTTKAAARTRKPALPRSRETRVAARAARIPVQPRSAPAPASGKLGRLVELMRRPEGASLQQLCAETNWQPHSVRGALAGSLKRSRGYEIASERIDGVRIYRIEPQEQPEVGA